MTPSEPYCGTPRAVVAGKAAGELSLQGKEIAASHPRKLYGPWTCLSVFKVFNFRQSSLNVQELMFTWRAEDESLGSSRHAFFPILVRILLTYRIQWLFN